MTLDTDIYQEIRPYNDHEIEAAVTRLINDAEFIDAILQYRLDQRFSWLQGLMRPILKAYLKLKLAKLKTVHDVQLEMEGYLTKALDTTCDGLTFSGLDKLDTEQSYLFISNHRDIAMDPALVNYGLHHSQHKTVRIAIGDNLLKKPCVKEIMKLNKSFTVNRSAKAPRELMKALSLLSSYIKHSLESDNSIWIAQREGRAKDGNDMTEPAILKMLHVEGRKKKMSFSEYMQSLKIVPVAISYENDPCDMAKANELSEKASQGSYEKAEFEDVTSIVQGIMGYKGRIHVSFGDVIKQPFDEPEQLASEIDKQIHRLYKLFPANLIAAQVDDPDITDQQKSLFTDKLAPLSDEACDYLTQMYANPVYNQKNSLSSDSSA
jgi:1-acyl-sn-glycerol-3-phosphate acyltransferase